MIDRLSGCFRDIVSLSCFVRFIVWTAFVILDIKRYRNADDYHTNESITTALCKYYNYLIHITEFTRQYITIMYLFFVFTCYFVLDFVMNNIVVFT